MIEISGDLWAAYDQDHWVAITTNGVVRRDGACVMGRGVALQAACRWPQLPHLLGEEIGRHGNHVVLMSKYRIASFPVKHHWMDKADPNLIVRSAQELVDRIQESPDVTLIPPFYLVRPGCGNGQLRWEDVRPLIAPILDDRFVIVERP
jgi:hypothetical protein